MPTLELATGLTGHKREAIRRIGRLGSVVSLDAEVMADLLEKDLISIRQGDGRIILTDRGILVSERLTAGR